ncbi:MAG: phosphoribosylformylglycinamidine cyclo-ligase [Culicoidibacterales bacterium]
MSELYKAAGVDLEAGYEAVARIKKHVERTKTKGCQDLFGAFGGMFDLSEYGYKQPVLVSGTDGVGTKLLFAIHHDQHTTIGQDLVAMCVNDIIAQGAKPLFFLDYIACDHNRPEQIEQIVAGIADGCVKADCALIGGETAEMPNMYSEGHYDLAGFVVGAVEKTKLITGKSVKPGQTIIGLASSGVHSNGYSLVHKLFTDANVDVTTVNSQLGKTPLEAVLEPTAIYVKPVLAVMEAVNVHGAAHITGGGFYENVPRTLNGFGATFNHHNWPKPAIFDYLQQLGSIDLDEMYNVYNMGIGFMLIVDSTDVEQTLAILAQQEQAAFVIGEVTPTAEVVIER